MDILPLALAGRLLLGLAGESIGISQAQIMSSHFDYDELPIALGISLSLARMGSVVNDLMSPWLVGDVLELGEEAEYSHDGVLLAIWTGVGICVCCYLASCLLLHLDGMKVESNMHYVSL